MRKNDKKECNIAAAATSWLDWSVNCVVKALECVQNQIYNKMRLIAEKWSCDVLFCKDVVIVRRFFFWLWHWFVCLKLNSITLLSLPFFIHSRYSRPSYLHELYHFVSVPSCEVWVLSVPIQFCSFEFNTESCDQFIKSLVFF